MAKNKKIKILNIVGARPNFMKIAPLFRAYKKNKLIQPILVHTNQHSDDKMSGTFFKSLGIPDPHHRLQTDNSSTMKSIHSMIRELDTVLSQEKPGLVVVVGDVNSTLVGALVANKMGIKVAHVEAGLRSSDRSMPEEINRILTDHISDFLFVSEKSGLENLKKENIDVARIFFVGNTMIDNLIHMTQKIDGSKIHQKLGLDKNKKYAVMTMHRPANVDSLESLKSLLKIVEKIPEYSCIPVIFPIHPRTENNLKKHSLYQKLESIKGIIITKPMDYIDFIKLVKDSSFVLTDSGGIQEEAAFLKVPVITLRDSTERPATLESGANVLHDINDLTGLKEKIKKAIILNRKKIRDIPLNDGKASERIASIIVKSFKKK